MNRPFKLILAAALLLPSWTPALLQAQTGPIAAAALPSQNSRSVESADLNEAFSMAQRYKESGANVWLILDFDNTLSAAETALGSDQWFTEAENQIKSWKDANGGGDAYFNQRFPALLELDVRVKPETPHRTTQSDWPARLAELQASGLTVFILTSRGPEQEAASIIAIERMERETGTDIDFSRTSPGTETTSFSHPNVTRAASYRGGVFYTSGLHKGQMLLAMMDYTGVTPDAVVFADDKKKHTDRVHDSAAERGLRVHSYRYSKEDGAVAAYNSGDNALARVQLSFFLENGSIPSNAQAHSMSPVSPEQYYQLLFASPAPHLPNAN